MDFNGRTGREFVGIRRPRLRQPDRRTGVAARRRRRTGRFDRGRRSAENSAYLGGLLRYE